MSNIQNGFYIEEQLSENISLTPENFLLCKDVPLTRTGVFLYREGEVPIEGDSYGVIRIERDADEVFAERAITSCLGKPITINHPEGFVNPDNWKELAVGNVQNVRRGEGNQIDLLLGDLLVTDSKAIELVKAGLRQISLGYDAEYEQTDKGKGRQTDITMNHVALVLKGRAGDRCKINDKKTCDSCGTCKSIEQNDNHKCNCNNKQEEKKMTWKDKIQKWLDKCPVKDEDGVGASDLEDIEDDTDVKAVAKDKKMKDDELEKEMKKDDEEVKKEMKDKKSKDDEEGQEITTLEDLAKRISTLENIIDALVASDKEVHESMDKKFRDEEEKETEKEEEKEKEEKIKEETADCEAEWPDVLYRAEVLCPGIDIRKPTKDHAKSLKRIKVAVLKAASMKKATKDSIDVFTNGKEIDELKWSTIDSAFAGASELVAKLNNAKVQMSSANIQRFSVASNVHSINEKNKNFYKTN